MEHLGTRLKVNFLAKGHAVRLRDEFVDRGGRRGIVIGHQVILNAICRRLHPFGTLALPAIMAVGTRAPAGTVELNLLAPRDEHLGEEHGHESPLRCVAVKEAVVRGMDGCRAAHALPVFITVPVVRGAAVPHEILWNDVHA